MNDTLCQICKKNIDTSKDLSSAVFCPVCGAPYHKNCFSKLGKCTFEKVHGTDSDYCHLQKVKTEDDTNQQPKSIKDVTTLSGKIIFNLSPKNIKKKLNKDLEEDLFNTNKSRNNNSTDFFKEQSFAYDDEFFFEEVSSGDLAKFIFLNSEYYLENCKKIEKKKRPKFNFCAFWFPAAWFLYRKQYKIGSVLLFLGSFLSVFSSFLKFKVLPEILKIFLGNNNSIPELVFFNYSDFSEGLKRLSFTQKIILFFPAFSEILTLLIMVLSGIFANKIYLKFCTRKIKDIKNKSLETGKYNRELFREGGVNAKALFLAVICYLIANYLPGFFMR